VTAREMYNIAVAAMEGRAGEPGRYRDHVIPPPPAARQARGAHGVIPLSGRVGSTTTRSGGAEA
jgi:hypothetical protein